VTGRRSLSADEQKDEVDLGVYLSQIATNSAKYGVLSGNSGSISVHWDVVDSDSGKLVILTWTETDGPEVKSIASGGFGTVVLKWRHRR
jgi:two-component sensor histidine kinase